MKNGSKLLLSLLAQGAVIGSVIAYKKIKGEKKSDAHSDLNAAIDEVEQKDHQTSQKTEKATDQIEDLLGDIEKTTKKVSNIIDNSTSLIDLIADFVKPQKPTAQEAKKETVQPQKPTAQEAKKETVQPQKPAAQEAKKETVQPQKPAAQEAKKETTQPQKPTAPEVKKQHVKTAEDLNNNLLSQINGYKKPNPDEIVTKNKVNLPTPKKGSKAQELNERIEAAIKEKNVLTSQEVGEKVRDSLIKQTEDSRKDTKARIPNAEAIKQVKEKISENKKNSSTSKKSTTKKTTSTVSKSGTPKKTAPKTNVNKATESK